MLKKVVVVYPCPHETYLDTGALVNVTPSKVSVAEKTFEGEQLEPINTKEGNLIIKELGQEKIYAVFKHWIYWENKE